MTTYCPLCRSRSYWVLGRCGLCESGKPAAGDSDTTGSTDFTDTVLSIAESIIDSVPDSSPDFSGGDSGGGGASSDF